MRLSFMTWVCPGWDRERIADFVGDTAYDGVEIRVDAGHAHGLGPESSAADREAAVELFEAHGVDVPAVATGAEFAHSGDETRAAAIDAVKANVELAADLGADVVRVFAGGDREEMTEAAAVDAAGAFTEVGEFAEAYGVTPLLETAHDIVQTPDDAHAVLDRVGTDNVGILWNRASIDPADFEAIREDVAHVHMHEDALDPEFDGVLDMIERFREAGYEGYFSLEIIRGEDLPEAKLRETGERLRGYASGSA